MQLVKGRAVWLLLVFACVLPHAYGSQVFQTAETLAVPRPFAEAAVLLSLAALISGRPRIALALVLVGFVLHPIMALAGAGVLALAYWHDWRVIAAALAAHVCALLLALLGAAVRPARCQDRLGVAGFPAAPQSLFFAAALDLVRLGRGRRADGNHRDCRRSSRRLGASRVPRSACRGSRRPILRDSIRRRVWQPARHADAVLAHDLAPRDTCSFSLWPMRHSSWHRCDARPERTRDAGDFELRVIFEPRADYRIGRRGVGAACAFRHVHENSTGALFHRLRRGDRRAELVFVRVHPDRLRAFSRKAACRGRARGLLRAARQPRGPADLHYRRRLVLGKAPMAIRATAWYLWRRGRGSR